MPRGGGRWGGCCGRVSGGSGGGVQRVPVPRNMQFVIAKLTLEFRAEMHWPGVVEIGTRIERIGRASVTLAQALFVGGACVAVAHSIVALMDRATRRAVALPQETVAALRAIGRANGHAPESATHRQFSPP